MTNESYKQILGRLLTEAAKNELKWIIRGIVGLSVFCICLGILGLVAVIKSIFL